MKLDLNDGIVFFLYLFIVELGKKNMIFFVVNINICYIE